MRAAINSLFAVLFLSSSALFAQNSDIFSKGQNPNNPTKTPSMEDYLFDQFTPDYKIISSNGSYIEIEYFPQQLTKSDVEYGGERLSVYNFRLAGGKNFDEAGSPDLRYRSFAVITPSELNNSVQVIDFDVTEQRNVAILPIPQLNFKKPNSRNFEDLFYTYNKGPQYTQNRFLPDNIAQFKNAGSLRELPLGNLIIYPYQYNPVSRTLKVYSRIRVRISFGDPPVLFNKPRSREEVSLLSGIALNSDIALNWLNPKLRNTNDNTRGASSVLASGDWYKIEIKDNGDNSSSEGMYKLTRSFLEGAGINFNNVDPRHIKIYGNGGELLPEGLPDPRPVDLVELAVYVEGEADGRFDPQDYILFYARSINNWTYDSANTEFKHYVNYYSRSNYYWICLNTPNNGRRMQLQPSENVTNPFVPASFLERIFYEPEQSNLINEGNVWLSIRKSPGQSLDWSTTLSGLENNSNILYKIKVASRCMDGNSNHMLIKDDYSTLSEIDFSMGTVAPGFGNWIWTNYPDPLRFIVNQSQKTNGEQAKFRMTYLASNSESEGYLDWMEIQYKRRLNSAQDDRLRFDSPVHTGVVEYNISSFSNNSIKAFDATVHDNVKIIQPLAVNSSNVRFQKTEDGVTLSKYFVIGQNGYKTPTSISSRIANQNLRGITEGADFIIVTHNDFLSAAQRLKNKREAVGTGNPDYLKTLVVTTDQIFNEYSGGVLDAVAIRDFLKHAYETWTRRPVYVCFFGDGSFDYKDILHAPNRNFVPAFEKSDPFINQVAGFTSDDFYANVVGNNFPADPPDLGHGRIPASSEQEVKEYLDKADTYESGVNNGYWKNKMLFVADDQKTSEGCEFTQHLAQCESLAEFYTPQYIDKIKVYLVTYPTVITPQGRRKPEANSDIAKYWTEGVLNIHYTGHGSPDVWAHEYVLEKDNIISQINNVNKYPFVSIASCDMSKFDNPLSQSAGEQFMLVPKKGAIGTIAATRPVYAESNALFFYELFENLYLPRDTLLLQKRFGKAVFDTKQEKFSENDLKYVLMCDPTIRVQMPRYRSHIDSISGLSGDTMRALSKIKIYGSVLKPDSSYWNNYNGKIVLKIYDVDRQVTLTDECGVTHNFRQNGGAIYSGIQTITNGRWTVEYIVPRDISYRNQNGRLIDYFYNTQADGSGIYRNFIVGGINPNAPVDSVGPKISLFLNTRNFRSGDLVNENFKFIADLFDESGINTTGTIGHKLEAVLDGNENNKYDLTNFYTSDSSYKSGTVEFDFSSIALGRHSLRFKAWDTYNNSSEATIDFNVSTSSSLQVTNVYNYPNPFKDNTAFTFQHNYPTDINVRIKIYTVAGRLIKEIQQNNISDKFVVVNWSGKDEDGETLGNGVYIYKLIVETAEGSSVTNTGKLAVLK